MTSAYNIERNKELDIEMEKIYRGLPRLRMLPASDRETFRPGIRRVKKYRINKKENWLRDARRMKQAFFDNLTADANAFLAYFDNHT